MAEPVIFPPELAPTAPVDHSRRQLEALLEVSETDRLSPRSCRAFPRIARAAAPCRHFDYLGLILHDPERQVMRLHILETLQPVLTKCASVRELPVSESPSGRVFENQQSYVVSEFDAEGSVS